MSDEQERPIEPLESADLVEAPEVEGPAPAPRRRNVSRIAGIIVGVLVIAAIVAIAVYAVPMLLRPDPRLLLAETVSRYSSAEYVQTEGTMSFEMELGGQGTSSDVDMQFAWAAPNKVLYKADMGMISTTTVSDGTDMYMSIGMLDAVLKVPAPATLAEMPMEGMGGSLGGGMPAMKIPDARSLIAGDFAPDKLTDIHYGFDRDDEWLGSLEEPRGTWPITVSIADGVDVVMWIDRATRLVKQSAMAFDFDSMMAAMKEADPESEELEELEQAQETVRSMFGDMIMRIVLTENETVINEAPPEGTFNFTPPEGATVIEADDFEEAMEKLMAESMPDLSDLPEPEAPDMTGEQAPEIIAQDMQHNEFRLSSLQGKPTILHILDPEADGAAEALQRLAGARVSHRELQVVAAAVGNDFEAAADLFARAPTGVTGVWLAPAAASKVGRDYGTPYGPVEAPRTIAIDATGQIVADTGESLGSAELTGCLAALGLE